MVDESVKTSTLMPTSDSQIVVHGREGPYLMDKARWPSLILPSEQEGEKDGMGELTQEDSMTIKGTMQSNISQKGHHNSQGVSDYLDEMRGLTVEMGEDIMDKLSYFSKDLELDVESQGWQSPKSKKSKKKKRKPIVVATRTSSRIARDGVPIATKAKNRSIARNCIPGTTSVAPASSNPFTILNNTSISSLQEVMVDLDLEADNFEEQIDVFRIEELARAAIAEANYRSYLDKLKEKTMPQDDCQIEDLAMEVISNEHRGIPVDPSKGGGDKDILVSLTSSTSYSNQQ
jgi:hypothetical protein